MLTFVSTMKIKFLLSVILDICHVIRITLWRGHLLTRVILSVKLLLFYCSMAHALLSIFVMSEYAMLYRKFHISQISHRVKNWYQFFTFGKCEICVWSILIILGV